MRVLGRVVLAAFCWMTAAYAFVTSSAFAYRQLVRPRLFPWVGQFSDWHRWASLLWLVILIAFVWRDLRPPAGASLRGVARLGLAGCVVLCVLNLAYSVLPTLSWGPAAIAVGTVSLFPLAWLAALDHLRAAEYLRSQVGPEDDTQLRGFESRTLLSALAAGALVTVLYAVLTVAGLMGQFEPDLLMTGLALGFATSLAQHLSIFVISFLIVALIIRSSARSFRRQYGLLVAAFACLFGVLFDQWVGRALSFHGASATIAAVATAISVVGVWTGARLASLAARNEPCTSALDLFCGRAASKRNRFANILRFAGPVVVAYAGIATSARGDWDFTILQISVLIAWLSAYSAFHRALRPGLNVNSWATAAICVIPLVAVAAVAANRNWHSGLKRYAVYNPSFRMTDAIWRASESTDRAFNRYLQAHTGLTDIAVPPADIDFVPQLAEAPGGKPLLFLFVIDSLRPDYLAPYNASVKFTPGIAQFASESTVFSNAFTAFGGTGLSAPAIWAGASIVHKQYAKPFHPMNALEKLLDANGYHRIVGLDSIMGPLLEPSSDLDQLDRGLSISDFEFCRTLSELGEKLEALDISKTLVFAHSRPEDIHLSRVPRIVESGEAYRGFHAPYATKVQRLDGCFGEFIDRLKRLGVYDRSLIVLTSDHGEMLGEDGRFGHSYHLFPQIVQVPLIVHFPSWIDRSGIDADAVSRTVDITPTIYSALRYPTGRPSVLMGRPLFGLDEQQLVERRRDTYVIASSYGAVYATLRHNGRRLYIVDAIRGGDQAFERDRTDRWEQTEITDGLRAVNQLAIRLHVDEIARTYHLAERQ